MAFIKCAAGGIKDFNLPMAFVVDYLGYKLYACAQLPIKFFKNESLNQSLKIF